MGLGRFLPWWGIMAAKIVLARLPVGYSTWRRLGLFRHGAMLSPDYAHSVFLRHFSRADFARQSGGYVALELGPGDSCASAIVAFAHGARTTWLVDTGPYAEQSVAAYERIAAELSRAGLEPPSLAGARALDDVLARCGGRYLVHGLESLRTIPDESVDFIWSQAVLEHVPRHVFTDTLRETWRILRPDGVCSHRIDLRDHLGGRLNNLRFSTRLWETSLMASSGFYTNRIGLAEMCGLFRQAGFEVQIVASDHWDELPTPRDAMAGEFRAREDGDLTIQGFDVLLRKAAHPPPGRPSCPGSDGMREERP